MRIYCKASPMFKNPDPLIPEQDKGKFVRCSPGFHDVPEWVRKDATFISSVRAGVVEVIESKAAEKSVEKEEVSSNKGSKRGDK